jgi:hypothetical protein
MLRIIIIIIIIIIFLKGKETEISEVGLGPFEFLMGKSATT